MKKILGLMILAAAFSISVFAQNSMPMKTTKMQMPTDADKQANFDASGMIRRGAPLSAAAQKVSLAKAMKNPKKYAGKNVLVEGVIVRSCNMEGCWMELAPDANSKSIHIDMKNHAFFIPLNSAGYKARAEGVFSIKTLSKNDGASKVSFEATGVELTKTTK